MGVTKYHWNSVSDNVTDEFDGGGNSIASYITEPTLHGAVISQNRADSGERHFYGDGVGNVTEVTNAAGDLTDRMRYNAFGETIASTGATTLPFSYKGGYGYYTDAGQDQIYVRARSYRPAIARWLSLDPLRFCDEQQLTDEDLLGCRSASNRLSAYAYVDNSPVSQIDPSGQAPCPPPLFAAQRALCLAKFPAINRTWVVFGCKLVIIRGEPKGCHTCCFGSCQFYEGWCIWGANLPPNDKGKPAWQLSVGECRDCADKCMLAGGAWPCRRGGGRGGPRWPSTGKPFIPVWAPQMATKILECRAASTPGAAGGPVAPPTKR